jgi:hypothetical protein
VCKNASVKITIAPRNKLRLIASPQAEIRRRAQRAASGRAGQQFQNPQKRKRTAENSTPNHKLRRTLL